MIKYLSLCLFFLAFIHGTVASDDESQRILRRGGKRRSSGQSIAAIAASESTFSTLVSLLGATGLDRALDCRWSYWCTAYTVFAPTDDAFEALAEADETIFNALQEPEYALHLKEVLLYHVVKGSIKSTDIRAGPVKSQAGEELELSTEGGIKVNEANVIDPFDVKANNGRIHTIDSVLVPSIVKDDIPTTALNNPDFSILVDALVKANLVDALADGAGRFTVLAPTNDAFAKLERDTGITVESLDVDTLTNVLLYHVIGGIVTKDKLTDSRVETLSGEEIRVNIENSRKSCDITLNGSAGVIAADVLARNGVIHVIDEVLIPPPIAARANPLKSIVEVVQENPDFSILLSAVTQFADIVDALSSGGPFTVFAPTNRAFEELGLETVEKLSSEDPDALADILKYHVLTSAVFSTDLPESAFVNALNNKGIAIDARHGVRLNGNTRVIDADIETSDGVIHVIDKVLLPPENLVEVLKADGRFGTLLTAVGLVPGLAETLATTSPLTIFAPTDEAFAKIPENDLNDLLGNEPALARVLEYHVSPDFVPAQALPKSIPTLVEGESITVRVRRFWYWWRSYVRVTLNENVHVVDVDDLASNGVIHTINGVLLP